MSGEGVRALTRGISGRAWKIWDVECPYSSIVEETARATPRLPAGAPSKADSRA
jgi:hypothetical protein